MRYKITLSYDGTGLSGWQIQNNANSVQGELNHALETLLGSPAPTTGAGRTDSGVNAVNYVAHFDASGDLSGFSAEQLCYKLNAILPKTITVHSVQPAAEDFHARFGAVEREYCYFVHRKKDPFMNGHSFRCPYPLDLEKMNRAAAYLIGKQDFSCFEKTGGNNKTSICDITSARWETYTPSLVRMTAYPHEEGDYLVFRISADRFLRNMVRAIVGTLIDVGRGKHEPEWVLELIRKGSRSDSGESVPGNALFFCGARYE